MNLTDPVSDMLTRVRNAYQAKKPDAVLPYSRFKHNLATVLANHGWIVKAEVVEGEGMKQLKLSLRYDAEGQPAITGVTRVSKPGQRMYFGYSKLSRATKRLGMAIVSTSKGLMTDRQAREAKVGGEIICQIW